MKTKMEDANPKEQPLCDRCIRIRAIVKNIVETCKDDPAAMVSTSIGWLELVDISHERTSATLQ
jgi:hypothetical protein